MDILNKDAIPAARRAKAIINIVAAEPNNITVDDPEWVDPGDGSQPNQLPKYTDWKWLNELVWEYLKTRNSRGHEILAKRAAEPVEDIREP